MGLRVIAQWSGDGTLAEMEKTPKAKLNLLHCYRSMNYISRHMEEKYGIPWVEYNFFGPSKIAASLREIASHFDDTIKENAEKVIAKYQAMVDGIIAKYKPRLTGKKVMLYVGGLRPVTWSAPMRTWAWKWSVPVTNSLTATTTSAPPTTSKTAP